MTDNSMAAQELVAGGLQRILCLEREASQWSAHTEDVSRYCIYVDMYITLIVGHIKNYVSMYVYIYIYV
jgi:hypothetical protein